MNAKTPAFTLLELLISASLLAGLSVILLASLSGVITSYTQHTLATKSNIQGQLVMQQIKEAVSQAGVFQVLRDNDTFDSKLVVEQASRDADGVVQPDLFDLSLYCIAPASGNLMLFRSAKFSTTLLPVTNLFNGKSFQKINCDNKALNFINSGAPSPSTSTQLTADDVKVIGFDVREVGTKDYPAQPKDSYPALRIAIVTQYSGAEGGIERASGSSLVPPAQLLNETVLAGAASTVPNAVISGT